MQSSIYKSYFTDSNR